MYGGDFFFFFFISDVCLCLEGSSLGLGLEGLVLTQVRA